MFCRNAALLPLQYATQRRATAAHTAGQLADRRWPRGLSGEHAPFDALLAADILYEPEDLEPLLQLAPRLLAPDGVFWLAEPGRRVSQAFVRAALARGWRDDTTTYERIWPTEDKPVRVVVHRFRLPEE